MVPSHLYPAGGDGLSVLETLEAIKESMNSGKMVEVRKHFKLENSFIENRIENQSVKREDGQGCESGGLKANG